MTQNTKINCKLQKSKISSKKNKCKNLLLTVFAATTLFACYNKTETKENESFSLQGDTIIVPEKSIIASKLKLETVKNEPYQLELQTAGI